MSDDDWDVDLDTVNNLTSEESRWGGNVGGVINDTESMTQLREKVLTSDEQKRAQKGYQSSYGYGGKFGVEKDRMDKSALDATYKAEVAKHSSVVDNKVGFGGKFGVQRDRQDKSAADWSHKEQVDKHVSQRDYKTGFGGKFGVQKDRKDASAHGWERDPESASSAKPVAPAKPNFMAGVSVGNMKSKFEKPKSEDTTESVAKYRAARAEQERREREAQQQPTGTDAQQSPKSQVGSKQPNRAEEARQLVAQSKVSSAASQFNATPAPTPPMPQSQSKPLPPKANANVSSVSARFAEAAKKEEEERERERQREREKRAEEAKMREQQMQQQQQQKDEEEENERTMREQVKRDLEARDKERLIVEQQREAEESRVTDSGRGEGVNVVRTEGSVPGYGGIAEGVQTAGAHTVLTGEGRGMCATALFDYAANGDDELSFWAGDVITNIDTSLDEGWWMGSCNGISGLFPRNFVAVDESTSSVSHAQMPINVTPMVGRESDLANDNIYFDPSSATDPVEEASLDLSKLPQAVALYDFNSDDPQDLKFEPDETISVQNLENPDWWFGFIGPNRQGYFPANHVELLS